MREQPALAGGINKNKLRAIALAIACPSGNVRCPSRSTHETKYARACPYVCTQHAHTASAHTFVRESNSHIRSYGKAIVAIVRTIPTPHTCTSTHKTPPPTPPSHPILIYALRFELRCALLVPPLSPSSSCSSPIATLPPGPLLKPPEEEEEEDVSMGRTKRSRAHTHVRATTHRGARMAA